MTTYKFKNELFEKYLNLLGIKKQKPSYSYLEEIIAAQFAKIPFENISKLYYKKHLGLKKLIDFDLYIEGIEKYNFGGTCYAVNFYLYQLLLWLGYNVKLCGADMKSPDVHVVNIVTINGDDYLIDAGYAAPFTSPLKLFLRKDHRINFGNDHYILKEKDKDKRSKMELYRDGSLKHTYLINPVARHINDFDQVISDSFKNNSTFMNAILLARFETDRSLIIHNMTIKESAGTDHKIYSIDKFDLLPGFIEDHFGIPASIISETISGINLSGDAWT